jgi:hypothetical protein
MSHPSMPQGGTERFLLGLIAFFICFILLINFVVNQNYVALPGH